MPWRVVVRALASCCALLFLTQQPAQADRFLTVGGSGTDLATMRLLADAYAQHEPDTEIRVLDSLGSGGGVRAVAKQRLDIGLTSRPLSAKEKALPVTAWLYAKTPLVFATATHPARQAISTGTLFDVMRGKRQTWPDGTDIRIVLRPPSDSDSKILSSTYPEAVEAQRLAHQTQGIPVAMTDQDTAQMLERFPGSVATSSLALILAEQRPLTALTLDDVAPTAANLAAGRYRMMKPLYLVLHNDSTEHARRFAAFVTSDPIAARILDETGHLRVPVSPKVWQ